jgi:hypothetical protein
MTTLAHATSAVLGTVTTVATMTSQTVGVIASGVDMLDKYVQRAKEHQRSAALIEDADWLETLKKEAGLAQIKLENKIIAEVGSDLTRLNEHIARYDALFVTKTSP